MVYAPTSCSANFFCTRQTNSNQFIMKLLIVFFAVVAAAAAYPGYSDPWQSYGWKPQPVIVKSGWQPHPVAHHPVIVKSGWSGSYGWPSSYGSYGYQKPYHGYQLPYHGWQPQHHVHHVDAIHIPQQPAIPPVHPHPLKLDSHAGVSKIHYDHPHIPHPHLIGHEVAVHEPEVKHVVKTVHHGHGWA